MEYNVLGKTKLKVSKLSFGAATLGNEYSNISHLESERSVQHAIDCGINYFDVAPYYGRFLAEIRLGKALGRRRHEIILATKVGRYRRQNDEYFDFSHLGIQEALEKSLRRLRTDYIDIYQLHDIEYVPRNIIIDHALPTMMRLKKEGKIRFVGITGYSLSLLKHIANNSTVDTILSYSRYNLTDTSLNEVLGDTIKSKDLGLINASPLNMGLLTQKGPPDWHPASKIVKKNVDVVRRYCNINGINLEDIALQFALRNQLVNTTLVGMSNALQVDANINSMKNTIDLEAFTEIINMIKPVKNLFWKEGIPENFD